MFNSLKFLVGYHYVIRGNVYKFKTSRHLATKAFLCYGCKYLVETMRNLIKQDSI